MSDYIKGESGLRARITSKAAGFGLTFTVALLLIGGMSGVWFR